MVAHGRLFRVVDGARPGPRMRIGSPAKAWEEIELEMIVRVDQTRQDDATPNVHPWHGPDSLAGPAQPGDSPSADLDIEQVGPPRIPCHPPPRQPPGVPVSPRSPIPTHP